MEYISTRGGAPALDFAGATLAGLASDGGLYVPREWPRFSTEEIAAMAGLPYAELAQRIMQPFVGDSLSPQRLLELTRTAYGRFAHKAVTPLEQFDEQPLSFVFQNLFWNFFAKHQSKAHKRGEAIHVGSPFCVFFVF